MISRISLILVLLSRLAHGGLCMLVEERLWQEDRSAEIFAQLNEPLQTEALQPFEARWKQIRAKVGEHSWEDVSNGDSPAKKRALREIKALRTYSSNTLRESSGDVDRWQVAADQVESWAKDGVQPTSELILKLAGIINSKNQGLRQRNFGPEGTYSVDKQDLSLAMKDFDQWYAANRERLDPIALAALSFQRIVSTHPVEEGNGRTARLVRDWVLRLNGLPPAAPAGTDGGFVGRWNGSTPLLAIEETTRHIETTLALLEKYLGPEGEANEKRRVQGIAAWHLLGDHLLMTDPPGKNYWIEKTWGPEHAKQLQDKILVPLDFPQMVSKAQEDFQPLLAQLKGFSEKSGITMETRFRTPEDLHAAIVAMARRRRGDRFSVEDASVFYVTVKARDWSTLRTLYDTLPEEIPGLRLEGSKQWIKEETIRAKTNYGHLGVTFEIAPPRRKALEEWKEKHVDGLSGGKVAYKDKLIKYYWEIRKLLDVIEEQDPGPGNWAMPDPKKFGVRPDDVLKLPD